MTRFLCFVPTLLLHVICLLLLVRILVSYMEFVASELPDSYWTDTEFADSSEFVASELPGTEFVDSYWTDTAFLTSEFLAARMSTLEVCVSDLYYRVGRSYGDEPRLHERDQLYGHVDKVSQSKLRRLRAKRIRYRLWSTVRGPDSSCLVHAGICAPRYYRSFCPDDSEEEEWTESHSGSRWFKGGSREPAVRTGVDVVQGESHSLLDKQKQQNRRNNSMSALSRGLDPVYIPCNISEVCYADSVLGAAVPGPNDADPVSQVASKFQVSQVASERDCEISLNAECHFASDLDCEISPASDSCPKDPKVADPRPKDADSCPTDACKVASEMDCEMSSNAAVHFASEMDCDQGEFQGDANSIVDTVSNHVVDSVSTHVESPISDQFAGAFNPAAIRKYCFKRPIATDKHAIASAWQQWYCSDPEEPCSSAPGSEPVDHCVPHTFQELEMLQRLLDRGYSHADLSYFEGCLLAAGWEEELGIRSHSCLDLLPGHDVACWKSCCKNRVTMWHALQCSKVWDDAYHDEERMNDFLESVAARLGRDGQRIWEDVGEVSQEG